MCKERNTRSAQPLGYWTTMLRCQPQAIAKQTRNRTGKCAGEGSYLPGLNQSQVDVALFPAGQAGARVLGIGFQGRKPLSWSSDTIGRCDEALSARAVEPVGTVGPTPAEVCGARKVIFD